VLQPVGGSGDRGLGLELLAIRIGDGGGRQGVSWR
jgi:hypothetical protein